MLKSTENKRVNDELKYNIDNLLNANNMAIEFIMNTDTDVVANFYINNIKIIEKLTTRDRFCANQVEDEILLLLKLISYISLIK